MVKKTGGWMVCFVLAFFGVVLVAEGRTIGQWTGSLRSWNYLGCTDIHDALIAAGHTIPADVQITVTNLATYDSFLMGEPTTTPPAAELSTLQSWIMAGGQLLLLNESSSDAGIANSILNGIGSTMTVDGWVDQNFYLTGSIYAITGPPYNVANLWLNGTPGRKVLGGTYLTTGGAGWTPAQTADAQAYIRYERLGLGYVIVFADRSDVNYFNFDPGTPRLNFFTNLASFINVGIGPSCTAPSIATHPQSQGIIPNQTVTLTVSATGSGPFAYQWYQGPSGDTSVPVGVDSNSFTTPALTAATAYWARITNACGTADSNTATITMNTPAIPTMTEWGMLILTMLLGIGSAYYLRRQRLTV